ncbi:putative uncharacterized protein NEXN-AS1 [Trichechus manatus latirostris]|uniref:Uncharacterized protein n=1 Tax=Trichechus manatus latirostris TaxID=127582 RepID=A0A2Y9FZR5_TRIMA|nr:putative uncharacterized protein NEXN-AS1 [Trichechus manatus latirostris]
MSPPKNKRHCRQRQRPWRGHVAGVLLPGTTPNFTCSDPKGTAKGLTPTSLKEGSFPTGSRRRVNAERQRSGRPSALADPEGRNSEGRFFRGRDQSVATAGWSPTRSGAATEPIPETKSASLQPPCPPGGPDTSVSQRPSLTFSPLLSPARNRREANVLLVRGKAVCVQRLSAGRGLGATAAAAAAPAAGSPLAAAAAAVSSSKFP